MLVNNQFALDKQQSLPELLVLNIKEVGGLHKEHLKKNLRLLLRQGDTLPTALDMDMCACHEPGTSVFTNVHVRVSR
jgi:hypothetical protein